MDRYNEQHTQDIDIEREYTIEVADVVAQVYEALSEKGYNPVNQIVGYIMSGDPGYISSHKEARSKITKVERNKILEVLIREYIKKL